ncbi:MAG TPA: phospholipase D-like domain-containing protein DpdK [Solirubrobacterales bacterium]|nr:phospholipase D-like domain-containing protein DpdK [Solirubrobacterales bacterium]
MTDRTARTIYKRYDRAREEVHRLLAGIFAGEVLAPSREVWLISPWIRNITVLDNRAGDFATLQPAWGRREIRLFDCLRELLEQGTTVRVKTTSDQVSVDLLDSLRRRAEEAGLADHLETKQGNLLHTKGLLTSRCLLRGSMNFTFRGVELNEEAVTYDTDPTEIAEMRISVADQW